MYDRLARGPAHRVDIYDIQRSINTFNNCNLVFDANNCIKFNKIITGQFMPSPEN